MFKKIITSLLLTLALTLTISTSTHAANPATPATPADSSSITCKVKTGSSIESKDSDWELKDNQCIAKTANAKKCSDLQGNFVGQIADGKVVCKSAKLSAISNPDIQRQINFLLWIQDILNQALWPILLMIGGLLDNSLLFGSGMEERLREIWIPIRNIVNILFVVVLVGIALYNVLGLDEEGGNYSLKSILPKIIIGIIAINFSFLGIKVFLDGINVLTTSIFLLPNQVNEQLTTVIPANSGIEEKLCKNLEGRNIGSDSGDNAEDIKAEIKLRAYRKAAQKLRSAHPKFDVTPADGITEIDSKIKAYNSDSSNTKKIDEEQFKKDVEDQKERNWCSGGKLTTQGKISLRRWNSNNAAMALAINMGNVLFYENIPLTVDNLTKMAINIVFSVMMYLIFVASFLALFVVLLGRIVVLWLAIALSPVLLIGIAVPAIKEQISGFGEITDQFVKNAIAPIGIALSMTVGWIMLNALQSVNRLDSQLDFSNGLPVMGLNTLQDLIVALGTVAVVWLGVFTAASNSIAAPVTDFMKESLTKAGKWIGTTPLRHTPLPPIYVPGHGKVDDVNMAQGVQAIREAFTPNYEKNRKLSNLLTGKSANVGLNELRDMNSKDDVYKVLNGNRGALTNPTDASIKEVKEFYDKQKNGAHFQMKNSSDPHDRKAAKLIEDIATKGDKKQKQQWMKDLSENYKVKSASPLRKNEARTEPGKPPKPKPAIKKGDTFAGEPVKDQKTADALSRGITDLKGVIGKNATNSDKAKAQAEVTKELNGKLKVKGKLPSSAELKSSLGAEDYQKLVAIYGGQDKLDAQINKVNNVSTAAPAAARPAPAPAPAATTPAAPDAAAPAPAPAAGEDAAQPPTGR